MTSLSNIDWKTDPDGYSKLEIYTSIRMIVSLIIPLSAFMLAVCPTCNFAKNII